MTDLTGADEYTSSVERLRSEYVEMREEHFGFSDLYAAEWDRIMAAHDLKIRADERERLLKSASDWAERAGVPLIEVPATVVLYIDDREMTSEDVRRGQELWAQRVADEIASA
jgi:hypothetical protein